MVAKLKNIYISFLKCSWTSKSSHIEKYSEGEKTAAVSSAERENWRWLARRCPKTNVESLKWINTLVSRLLHFYSNFDAWYMLPPWGLSIETMKSKRWLLGVVLEVLVFATSSVSFRWFGCLQHPLFRRFLPGAELSKTKRTWLIQNGTNIKQKVFICYR